QILNIGLAAVEVGLNDGADRRGARPHALHEFDRALRVKRAFHVNAEKILVSGGSLGDGKNQAFTEIGTEIKAHLRELAGNVGVQALGGDTLEDFEIGVAGALRIGGARDVFAKIIEADQ